MKPVTSFFYSFKSSAVKLTLFTAFLFSLFSLILLSFIYFTLIESRKRNIDDSLRKEARLLEKVYNEQGYVALERKVFIEMLQEDKRFFAIYNSYGEKRLGDLYFESSESFKHQIETRKTRLKDLESQEIMTRHVRVISIFLAGGNSLYIGRDIEDLSILSKLLFRVFILTVFLSLVLALLAGYLVNRNFSNRIEAINKVARAVHQGILSKRIARTYTHDELDLLGQNLNTMLEKIELLMKESRMAGDNLAHDLRSPLSRLRSRLETTALHMSDDMARRELMASVSDTTDLLKTFEAILRISRLEAGEQRGVFVELDPGEIIADIKELYEPACEEKQLEFNVEISSDKHILADRALLAQALSNLVDNALKYTPKGESIVIGYKKLSEKKLEIYVEDTGIGIAEDKRDAVIKRFVRLDKSRSKPGSGLGLSLVKAIADIHNAKFILDDAQKQNKTLAGLRARLVFLNHKKNNLKR